MVPAVCERNLMMTHSTVTLADGIAGRVAPGPGETVLWIHGYTLDSSIWEDLWHRLPNWRHVGLDLPGHGGSAPLQEGEDLPEIANRIGRLAVEQKARHLVGLSFGGMVALQAALQFPTFFVSMVLNSPGLGGGPQDTDAQICYVELATLYRERGYGPWLAERWLRSPPDIFTGAADHPALWTSLREVV